jgi:hypothetical protein
MSKHHLRYIQHDINFSFFVFVVLGMERTVMEARQAVTTELPSQSQYIQLFYLSIKLRHIIKGVKSFPKKHIE